MGWLFWRSKKLSQPESASTKKRAAPLEADADDRVDPAQQLRVRARRRLIGAAALLLAVAVVVPMVLDDNVRRPVADNVPIDIPSEKSPFTPRLSLPPVPEPGNVPLAPPPDTSDGKDEAPAKAPPAKDTNLKAADSTTKPPAKAADKTSAARTTSDKAAEKASAKPADKPVEKQAEKQAEKTAEKPVEKPVARTAEKPADKPADKAPPKTSLAAADEQRAREILEGKPAAKPAATKNTRFALQAAAPREESDAQELADRLKKAGYASYVERVEAKDGTRYRVRIGPYASRDEAERVRARLRALDVNATLVAPGT